jgi:hypothetical protein
MTTSKRLLKKIEEIRSRNNTEWMKLIQLGLTCDQIKHQVIQTLRRIEKNDALIQQSLKRLRCK